MLIIFQTAAIILGYILDLIIGDPRGWPHIVIGFGRAISFFEKIFYKMKNKRLGGTLLWLCVIITCAGIPSLLLGISWRVSPWAYLAMDSLICWQLLAVKSLRVESLRVYDELEHGTLESSRQAVHMIVGRDPDALDRTGIIKAAVETVAENTSDGVAAPLFYMFIGGAAGGCLYKAVNTMDSMIGYNNSRYHDFGRAAARMDDVFNYLPSRLCALFMILSSRLRGFDAANARRIWKRDRRKHASPNAAQTESVMAGALDVQLAGDAVYSGRVVKKPFIGDDIRPIGTGDILASHKILNTTAFLMFSAGILLRIGFILLAVM
ncbi:adenosylcobinamide-phosphate synthase CbiB [Mobilibacterium timonense]|uniref:adenosylcobinamide-phosphate synthase CbiB n=1 Tax=Mobilibacterium timonense TaxID=1871012 RepID=UPI002ED3ECE3